MAPKHRNWKKLWKLAPGVAFLNHGSFGACPTSVLEAQKRWRARMERQPVQFFTRDLEGLLDEARAGLAAFIGAGPEDLAFVPNATTGVNAVLRSLRFAPGDEILATDHAYNACRNALEFVAGRSGARLVVAAVSFPTSGADQIVDEVLSKATSRTKLALLDHVTSPTALIFPIARLVAELRERGIDTLVDGAHAPGMLPLDIGQIGAAYYTGNCHKWLCAPKGAAFLHVRRDRQARVHPTVISHGFTLQRSDRSRYLMEFDWTGTHDPSPYLCVPASLRFMQSLLAGGWEELRARNHALAVQAREKVCGALGVGLPSPDEMIGSMATVPLADSTGASAAAPDRLQQLLLEEYRIEIPVLFWSDPPRHCLRLSVQLYNTIAEYDRLAAILAEIGS